MSDIKITLRDRTMEPFNFINVKSYTVLAGGVLSFVDAEGVEHVTNEEYHVKDDKKKS